MDVTLQRQDLQEIADRAAMFRDSMLRLRTDANRMIVSATGRVAAEDPISKVVPDSLLPAVVTTPGTANADPAELGKQVRALPTLRTRLVGIAVWPGFQLTGIDPAAPDTPVLPEPVAPEAPEQTFDASAQVAALIAAGRIKIRRAWTLPIFGLLTLGIYLVVWYHRINRELRDLGALSGQPGRALDVRPGRSTLAVTLGALVIVPPFVSVQRTLRRVQKAEQITDTPEPHLWASRTWVLFALVIPFWTAYVQAHLNRIWRDQLRRAVPIEPATPVVAQPQELAPAHPPPEPGAGAIETPAPMPSIEPWPVASPEPVIPSYPPPPLPPPEPVAPPPPPPPAVPVPPPLPAPVIEAPSPPPPPPPRPTPVPRVVAAAPPPKPDIHDPAIEIIRARYARGELTRQEYRDMLEDLA